MAFAPGRPGGKKTSQDKAKDKMFEEQKMRMLERAEKNLAKAWRHRPAHFVLPILTLPAPALIAARAIYVVQTPLSVLP